MLDIRPLSKALEEVAKKDLNERPERREEDIAHIREWIEKQPHLFPRTDDQLMITFLRCCKFSLERTKEKLNAFYTYRTSLPEFFRNRDPLLPELQDILDKGAVLSLGFNSHGHHVWFLRLGQIDTQKNKQEDIIKAFFMLFETIFLESDEATIFGQKILCDCTGIALAHAVMWSPTVILKSVTVWQNAYPGRVGGVEFVNMPSFFEMIVNLIRSVANEKLKKRICVHPNWKSVQEMKILPKDLGGNNDTVKSLTESIKKKLESYRDYFLEDDQYGVIESRRPGKPKGPEDLFGIEGSFRLLQID